MDRPVGEGVQQGSFPQQQERQELNYRDLTKDELAVIKQCSRDSFYKRCLPFGFISATAVHLLVKAGKLNAHPRFGSTPKSAAAILVAYILGKVSYQRTCDEKIMQLPNSRLADMVKRKYNRNFDDSEQPENWVAGQPGSAAPIQLNKDYRAADSIDMDSNRELKGLDETRRPHLGSSTPLPNQEEARPTLSYDDLRKQNRAQNSSRPFPPIQRDPMTPGDMPTVLAPSDSYSPSSTPTYDDRQRRAPSQEVPPPPGTASKRIRRNQYGDVIEE